MLCWIRTRCSFTTEAPSVPTRCSFSCARVPASWFWVLHITLPCSDLSPLPRWTPSAPLPCSHQAPAPLPASLNQALWLWMSATSQLLSSWLTRQGSHHGTVWGIDGSCWGVERRGKADLYCLAACWVKPVGLKRKRKGKGLLSIFFSSSSPSVFSNSEGQYWMPEFPVHVIKHHQGKEPWVRVCRCPMHPASPTAQHPAVLAHHG